MASSQRVLSGSQTQGSSATGNINRFRQGVNVLTMGQLVMGSTPKMRPNSRPVKLISGRIIADSAQYFNEAIEAPAVRTIVGGTASTSPLSSVVGRISFVPNQEIEVRDFGVPKLFNDGVPFEDMIKFDPVDFMHLSASYDIHGAVAVSGSLMFPRVLGNVSIRDPNQSDGAIEPLTIRDSISLSSTYSPFEAHSVYGFWCNGAESSRRRSTPIVQQIDLDIPPSGSRNAVEPYEDGGAWYMGTDLSGSINIPGFLYNAPSLITPWKESTDSELAYAKLLISSTLTNSADGIDYSIYNVLLRSTVSIDDLNDRHHKSATAGFIYINAEDGADSLAFGGLKK